MSNKDSQLQSNVSINIENNELSQVTENVEYYDYMPNGSHTKLPNETIVLNSDAVQGDDAFIIGDIINGNILKTVGCISGTKKKYIGTCNLLLP